MMLHLLVGYARTHDLVAEPGFKPKQVRWALACDPDGNYLNAIELGDASAGRNPGRTFRVCPDLSQPEMKRGGKGCRHFLVDNANVVTYLGDETNDPRLREKHAYFVELLKKASGVMPELARLAATLEDDATLACMRNHLAEGKARSTDNVTFAVLDPDPRFPVESDAWHDWWRGFRLGLVKKGEGKMRCFASGELVEPALTHPKITGLADVGGLATRDALASFKQDSFRSYGLAQSSNAAVSEEMASSCRAALDDLIQRYGYRLAGAKVVHWYAGAKEVPPKCDPFNLVEGDLSFLAEAGDEEHEERDAQHLAKQLLQSLRDGTRADLAAYRYYALTLSGASGRVMIRDWMEGQFDELVANIDAWFDDLAIVHRHGDALAKTPKFMAVLGGLVRDLNDLPPPLVAKMWRVTVRNEPIPQHAMAQALARVKVDVIQDQPANHARMGLIKAYHSRSSKGDRHMGPYLNEEHPHPAYHCGRLMAVLADLQRSALGDVGVGVVQRYYAAASSTPALVMGRLVRTSQFHLNELEGGLPHWYENQIASIWARIRDDVPKTLTLEEQSLFALGYYQQRAARKTRKEDTGNKS